MTITITTTSQQDVRIAAAYGRMLGLGRDATAAEVKQHIISTIRYNVYTTEAQLLTGIDPG